MHLILFILFAGLCLAGALNLLLQKHPINSALSLIVVMTTPWMVVMMVGYFLRRGYYLPEAMQVFNRGQEGGAYWFHAGWNIPGMSAWLLSAALALLLVNIPGHFVGWLGTLAGGVDISLLAALVLPALLYPALLFVAPEPRGVFGPAGARWVPTVARALAPVVQRGGATGPAQEATS